MTSGSSVHSEVQNKIRDVERQTNGLDESILSLERQITSFGEEREQAFTQLADIYSPELSSQSIAKIKQLPDIQKEINEAFAEKQRRRVEIEKYMADSQSQRKESESGLDSITQQLNKKIAERDNLRKQVAGSLGKIPEYTTLASVAQTQNEVLHKYTQRLTEEKTHVDEKLAAYRGNKLFMELVSKKFDTNEYTSGKIMKWFDSWRARRFEKTQTGEETTFRAMRDTYNSLISRVKLMELEIGKREEQLQKTVSEMRVYEEELSEKTGLTQVMQAGAKIEANKRDALAKIEKLDKDYKRYSDERAEMDSAKDPYHTQLTDKLKELLQGEDIADLKARARKYPGTADDTLVVRIEEIDMTLSELKEKAKEKKSERDNLAEKLDGLKIIERKARQYTSSDDYYSGSFDIGSLITGYVLGKSDSHHYNPTSIASTIESSHHVRQPEYHSSYTPSYNSPSHSSPSFSSHSIGGGMGGFSSSHSIGR